MAKNDNESKTRGQIVLEEILCDTGLTVSALADYLGVTKTSLQDLSCGRTKRFSNRMIEAVIVKYPQYDKFWLLSGEGAKYVADHQATVVQNTVIEGKNVNSGIAGHVGDLDGGCSEIIKRLLDELAAQRQQNQELIELLKKHI